MKTGDYNSRISLPGHKSTDSTLQNISFQKDCFDPGATSNDAIILSRLRFNVEIPRYPVTVVTMKLSQHS